MIKLCLAFSNPYLILSLLFIAFFVYEPKLVRRTMFIVAFSMILNVALKITFRIPVLPSVPHAGFAFPSGHMQFSTVFYLWCALELCNRSLFPLIFIILPAIGWALVAGGFHTPIDVAGGFVTGCMVVFLLRYAYQKWQEKTSFFLFMIAICLMSYIFIRQGLFPIHPYIAFSWMLFDRLVNQVQTRLPCRFISS